MGDHPDNFLVMSKFLWRQGLIRTPSFCSADTSGDDCMATCPESLRSGRKAEELFRTYGLYGTTSNTPLVEGYTAEELLTSCATWATRARCSRRRRRRTRSSG